MQTYRVDIAGFAVRTVEAGKPSVAVKRVLDSLGTREDRYYGPTCAPIKLALGKSIKLEVTRLS